MSSLKAALRSGTKIKDVPIQCSVSDLKEQRHYCQFSGGGDLYFHLCKQPTVVCTNAVELDLDSIKG